MFIACVSFLLFLSSCLLRVSPQSGMADWASEQRPLLADVLLLDPDAPMHLPLSKPSTGRHAAWGPTRTATGTATGTATAKARPLRSLNGVGANLLPGKRGGLALDAFYAGVMCTEAHESPSTPHSKVQRHAPSLPSRQTRRCIHVHR
jgi:hypothetical protein